MRKCAMISQPMGGKSDEEIKQTRDKAMKVLDELGYETLDSYFDFDEEDLKNEGVKHLPVYYLGKSLEILAKADLLYVCKGWELAPGCGIEIATARNYDIPVMYEDSHVHI